MKKFFRIIVLCFICTTVFACKSKNEKITKNYVLEKDFPAFVTATALANGVVESFDVKNFNNTPVDTLFEYQVFAKYSLTFALNDYVNSMKLLTDWYDFEDEMYTLYGDIHKLDVKRIKELKEQIFNDSIAYENAKLKHDELEKAKTIRAIGYEFDEVIKLKIAGQPVKKEIHKIIYIMDNEEVYGCRNSSETLFNFI